MEKTLAGIRKIALEQVGYAIDIIATFKTFVALLRVMLIEGPTFHVIGTITSFINNSNVILDEFDRMEQDSINLSYVCKKMNPCSWILGKIPEQKFSDVPPETLRQEREERKVKKIFIENRTTDLTNLMNATSADFKTICLANCITSFCTVCGKAFKRPSHEISFFSHWKIKGWHCDGTCEECELDRPYYARQWSVLSRINKTVYINMSTNEPRMHMKAKGDAAMIAFAKFVSRKFLLPVANG
jgi:hypothetical protein